MMKTTTIVLSGLLGAASLFAMGCGGPSYAHTDIDQVSQSALPASVTVQTISARVGGVVTAHIVSYNSDKDAMSNTVESDNAGVLEVSTTPGDHVYAFIAASPGTAHITVRADGDPVLNITATVDPQ